MTTLTALITGANRGIGLETARQLLKKNVRVILSCRDAAKGQAAVQQLREVSAHISFLPLDIACPEQVAAAADQVTQQYGHLDILINNAAITHVAGTALPKERISNTIMHSNIADIKAVFDVNVWGTLQLTQALFPLLQQSPAGRIINLSSELGSIQLQADTSSPIYHVKKFAYNSSKTMVNLLTVYLQEALRNTNVRAYTVSPGWVKTDMGTAAAFLEIPEGARIIVQAALEDVPTNRFFTHQWQEIPW
ncbi:SDR family NAD(P)-dependent oxidoreductase [Chitinophaga varians]|uniref:SDR family NAD(P)-dependent oxidoreductase n=1 Tax=Chitinophaga varians TaxID=2202339 RepID=A0A847RJV9_9BACT|nr:SDR family NAD(P)-dependent oxidoreductase [Chitinophaga varians]NLR63363.1 SDR family NAD(P)-dependent oxidoreductase [Chitinophaga varians]